MISNGHGFEFYITFSAGNICNRDVLVEMEIDDKIVDVDDNCMDPQFCATIACDIYKHLRASEVLNLPSCHSLCYKFSVVPLYKKKPSIQLTYSTMVMSIH